MGLAPSVLHPGPSLISMPNQLQRERKHADFLGFSSLSSFYRAAHPAWLAEGQVWLSPQQGLLADELKVLWGNQQGKKKPTQPRHLVSPGWTRSCSDLVQTWPGVGSEEGEDVTHIWDVATEDRCVLLLSSPSLQLCLSDSALPSGPSERSHGTALPSSFPLLQ